VTKILFVTNLYPPYVVGGAELTLQALAEQLVKRGVAVAVASLAAKGAEGIDCVNGVRIHRLRPTRRHGPLTPEPRAWRRALWHLADVDDEAMAARVGRVIDTERPDVVSTHNLPGFSTAVWGAVHARGVRLLHTLHDYYLLCPRVTMFRNDANCRRRCAACVALSLGKRRASRAVDAVIGVSRYVLDAHLSRGYFENARATVIYNARPWDAKVAEIPRTADAARVFSIGYIGRIEPEKGIAILLAATTRLPAGRWRLRIAGKAPDAEYQAELQRAFPSAAIEWLGFSTPAQFYPSIDVLVIPSRWHEPLGVVAYEAMGFGRPVIGARRGGIPEMIEGSGAGWLFDPTNVDELAGLLARAIERPHEVAAMRGACLEARRRFLPDIQTREFLALV
jgi:glycosyltransferase involved in cell wall biosynthesis